MPRLARVEDVVGVAAGLADGAGDRRAVVVGDLDVVQLALTGVRDVEAEVERVARVGRRRTALDDLDARLELRVRERARDRLAGRRRDGHAAARGLADRAVRAVDVGELVAERVGVGLRDRVGLARLDRARVARAVGEVEGRAVGALGERERRLRRRGVGGHRRLGDDELGLAHVLDRADDVFVLADGDVDVARALGHDVRALQALRVADVLGEVRAVLADGVRARRDGRLAVPAVAALRGDGRAVDLEVEAAGVRGGLEVLHDLDRAGLALVGERAGDRVADADLDAHAGAGGGPGAVAVRRAVAVDLADDALELVARVGVLGEDVVAVARVLGAGVGVARERLRRRGRRAGALEVERAGPARRVPGVRCGGVEVEDVGRIAALVDLRDLDRAVRRKGARGARGQRHADTSEQRREPERGDGASRPGRSRAENPKHRGNPQSSTAGFTPEPGVTSV